jgi:hypothetical protein
MANFVRWNNLRVTSIREFAPVRAIRALLTWPLEHQKYASAFSLRERLRMVGDTAHNERTTGHLEVETRKGPRIRAAQFFHSCFVPEPFPFLPQAPSS